MTQNIASLPVLTLALLEERAVAAGFESLAEQDEAWEQPREVPSAHALHHPDFFDDAGFESLADEE